MTTPIRARGIATPTLTDTTRDYIRRALDDEIAGQRATLAEYSATLDAFGDGSDVDLDDRMLVMELHDRAADAVAELESARARLDDGSYGACGDCGGAIAPARLEALPATRHCIRCAPRHRA